MVRKITLSLPKVTPISVGQPQLLPDRQVANVRLSRRLIEEAQVYLGHAAELRASIQKARAEIVLREAEEDQARAVAEEKLSAARSLLG